MNGVRALVVGLGGGRAGRRIVKQATRYEEYLIEAQACGVSVEQAKAVFEEEAILSGGFDDALQAAKTRIYSGDVK